MMCNLHKFKSSSIFCFLWRRSAVQKEAIDSLCTDASPFSEMYESKLYNCYYFLATPKASIGKPQHSISCCQQSTIIPFQPPPPVTPTCPRLTALTNSHHHHQPWSATHSPHVTHGWWHQQPAIARSQNKHSRVDSGDDVADVHTWEPISYEFNLILRSSWNVKGARFDRLHSTAYYPRMTVSFGKSYENMEASLF